MLIEAANRHNIQVKILDAENAPAKQISAHGGHITGSFAEKACIEKLSRSCDVLTVEIEHVDSFALEQVAPNVKIEPSWRTIRNIQDKYEQKMHLQSCGIAVADFCAVEYSTREEVRKVGQHLGYPFMLKARKQAYDGRGNCPVKSEDDILEALDALKDRSLYAEKWANFTKELAVMVVKTKDSVLSYPTVETVHQDSICKLVYAPARGISNTVCRAAQKLARNAVAEFDGKGVFGVEMFLMVESLLLINEIAPRPHNSGHYTIEACPVSQFEAHLRAILDIPIRESGLRLREPAIMLNILGGPTSDSHLSISEIARRETDASVHLYGKGDARPGRKMGHVTLTAPSMNEAERQIHPVLTAVDAMRAERSDIDTKTKIQSLSKPLIQPQVSITTGSISDQHVLEACYKTLDALEVHYEKRITSAHRTPTDMATFAQEAQSRGVKVIIAAAGGAAHLPGMVAAFSDAVPVVGLPIKPSIGDGLDSLLSLTNMPRGEPVLTVGINNAINAALGAATILGVHDERLRLRIVDYHHAMAQESRLNDKKMQLENNNRLK